MLLQQVLFYSRVTFQENITQIEHKIPILSSAFCGDWGIDSLILQCMAYTTSGHEGTIGCVCMYIYVCVCVYVYIYINKTIHLYTVYICFYTVYLLIYDAINM